MKGRITRIEEVYPNSSHWTLGITVATTEQHELRLGWIHLWLPTDPTRGIYHCCVEGITEIENGFSFLLGRELYLLKVYWSPEPEDTGQSLHDLVIGNIEFDYAPPEEAKRVIEDAEDNGV